AVRELRAVERVVEACVRACERRGLENLRSRAEARPVPVIAAVLLYRELDLRDPRGGIAHRAADAARRRARAAGRAAVEAGGVVAAVVGGELDRCRSGCHVADEAERGVAMISGGVKGADLCTGRSSRVGGRPGVGARGVW